MSDSNKGIPVTVRERILKPIAVVFDAVVDPAKMSHYFISRASGSMKSGPVTWEFGDLGAKVTLNVLEVEKDERIVRESKAPGQPTRSMIQFASEGEEATVVRVTERSYAFTPAGVKLAWRVLPRIWRVSCCWNHRHRLK
jgi:uncharacterized protein YndB with AHSA1/START domain